MRIYRTQGGNQVSENVKPLDEDQRLELAACYAEHCGVDPDNREEWRSEMVCAKRFVREVLSFWHKRQKRKAADSPTA